MAALVQMSIEATAGCSRGGHAVIHLPCTCSALPQQATAAAPCGLAPAQRSPPLRTLHQTCMLPCVSRLRTPEPPHARSCSAELQRWAPVGVA